MAFDKDFYWCVLHVSAPGGGFSEKYALKGSSGFDRPAAKSIGFELVARRAQSLASGTKIVWARVSRHSNPKDASRLLYGELPGGRTDALIGVGGIPAGETVNNVQAALHYRMESTDGQWGNRMLRGIPDLIVSNGTADLHAKTNLPPGDPYHLFTDDASFTHKKAMENFLTFVQRNCAIAKPEFVEVDGIRTATGKYDRISIAEIAFRKVGTHKTGRPFGFSPGRAKAVV